MTLMETIRAYLGWCPMTGAVQAELAVRSAATAAPGGGDGVSPTRHEWWQRYHNQLLVAAVAFSSAAVAAFLLIEDAPGHPTIWTGIGIGVGALIGFLIGCRKQYARVVAGEFIEANMTKRQRIVRRLSMPVAAVLLAAGMAYLVLGGMFDRILGIVLGMCLICWTWYGLTILWERQYRAIMIAEWGSTYVLSAAAQEGGAWR